MRHNINSMKTEINYYQPIYAFYLESEYHIITRISKDKYGVVSLFTDSYGIEEVESSSLKKTLELCRKKRWDIKVFNTYSDFFTWCIDNEMNLKRFDIFNIKYMTGRKSYIDDNIEILKRRIRNLLRFTPHHALQAFRKSKIFFRSLNRT